MSLFVIAHDAELSEFCSLAKGEARDPVVHKPSSQHTFRRQAAWFVAGEPRLIRAAVRPAVHRIEDNIRPLARHEPKGVAQQRRLLPYVAGVDAVDARRREGSAWRSHAAGGKLGTRTHDPVVAHAAPRLRRLGYAKALLCSYLLMPKGRWPVTVSLFHLLT